MKTLVKKIISKTFFILVVSSLIMACGGKEEQKTKKNKSATYITTSKIKFENFEQHLSSFGTLKSISSPKVSAQTTGVISKLKKKVGDEVKKGELIAVIDNTLAKAGLLKAKAQMASSNARIENQKTIIKRLQHLRKSDSYSQSGLEEAETKLEEFTAQLEVYRQVFIEAAYHYKKTSIVSPIDGVVQEKIASVGDYANVGTAIYKIVSTEHLEAKLPISQSFADDLNDKIEIILRTPTSNKEVITNKYTSTPAININNRSLNLYTEFSNPGDWFPGASVDATLILKKWQALGVFSDTIISNANGHSVFIVNKDNTVSKRSIKIGEQFKGVYEVLEGLKEGDVIVDEGNHLLKDKSLIKISK